jgi:fluoride ion exporter CrcB/FEX
MLADTVLISLLMSACIFAGGLIGLALHRFLPEMHLTKETQDVVRLGIGMVSILASLVLGLLVATAKTSFDATDASIRAYAADLILLDETLRDYGDQALGPREKLRDYTERLLRDNWPARGGRRFLAEDRAAGDMLEHVREAIRALVPTDAGQRWLQDQALQTGSSLLHQRWLLIEQAGPRVRAITVVILAVWVTMIFASFGLYAPRNSTVVAAFLVCSLAIGSALFLILELDQPFTGLLRLSPMSVETALAHMLPPGR